MEMVELNASVRPETGKKGARACRKKGLLPGVLYGKNDPTTPVAVNPKELDRVLHTHAGSNVVIKLSVDERGGEPVTVVVKELQVDNIKGTMRHVDFCQISLDETIRTEVPFKVVGEAPGVKMGGILEHILWELEIESLPMDIPDHIEVDVSELNIGDSLAVSDLKVPDGVTVWTDWDTAVVTVTAPRVEEVVEAAAPAEEVEGAEPEVVGAKPEKEAEEAEEKEKAESAEDKKKPAEKRKSKE